MSKGFLILLFGGFAAVFAATWLLTAPSSVAVEGGSAQAVLGSPNAPSVSSCEEAMEKGLGPFHAGQPNYRADLDPDGDGIACPPM